MHSIKRDMTLRVGVGAGILVALVALTLFVNADMSGRASNIQDLRRSFAERASAVERLARLRALSDEAVPYRSALAELLPKPEELVGFPREVRTIASAADVTAANVSLGAETAAAEREPGSIEVQFTVSGTLAKFIAFLKALEERAGFIMFSSIDAPITNRANAAIRAKVFSR